MAKERAAVRSVGRGLNPGRPSSNPVNEIAYMNLHGEGPLFPGEMIFAGGSLPGSGEPTVTNGLEQKVDALSREVAWLTQLVLGLSHQIESLQAGEPEEASEILDFQPSSRMRANAHVRSYGEPVRLQILENSDDPENTEE